MGPKKKEKKPVVPLTKQEQEAQLENELTKDKEMVESVQDSAMDIVSRLFQAKSYPLALQEMKHAWHLFKFASKLRSLYIGKLKDDLYLLEEQERIWSQREMEEIDDIITEFQKRSQKNFDEYVHKRDRMIKKRFAFLSYNIKAARSDSDYLTAAKFIVSKVNRQTTEELKNDLISMNSVLGGENQMEISQVVKTGYHAIEDTWIEIIKHYKEYLDRTKEKRLKYNEKKAKNAEDDAIIEKFDRRIAELQALRLKIKETKKWEAQVKSKITDLKAEKAYYLQAQLILRDKLVKANEEDTERFVHLSQVSSGAIKELQESLDLIEDILKYVGLCSKYETENEKTNPYTSLVGEVDIPLNKCFGDRFIDLDKFLFRIAQTDFQVDYMEKLHKEQLEENLALRNLLQEALLVYGDHPQTEGITFTPGVICPKRSQ